MTSDYKSVYLGIWTNWSHGAVAGLTYTTTIQNGGLIIAFLALFVTFTGTCFWTIVSFVVHQILSREAPQCAIYHQQQAILRSSDTSAAALWRLFKLLWAWRRSAPATSLKSTLLPLVASTVTFCAFAVTGLFSSRVATSRGGEVLVVGDRCATLNVSLYTQENYAMAQSYGAGRIRSSANYKSSCYVTSGSTENCRTLVRKALPIQITHGRPCPFPGKSSICRSSENALRLDSGLLNSNYNLGINSPPSSRFLYRTVSECAPILSEPYMRRNDSTSPKTVQLLYGDDSSQCGESPDGCTMIIGIGRETGSRAARNEYTVRFVPTLIDIYSAHY